MSTALTAKHELTGERLRSLVRYDDEAGRFYNMVMRGPLKIGQQVGCINLAGYVQIQIYGIIYYAHRLAWLYMTGKWPDNYIDHIDGDRANNRFKNLRDVTNTVNLQNQRNPHSKNKTSGLLGVSKHPGGRWTARIMIGKNYKHLGLFDTPELAHARYLEAKREYHEGCTI